MTISIQALNHVRHVAETGSYAAAARRLGVSQPAVSQQIRAIEAKYKVLLFSRINGQLQPTPLCTRLCDAAERVIHNQKEAELLLQRHGTLENGEISIGLGNAMPGMSLIADFNTSFPHVGLRVETGSHEKIIRRVLNHDVDIGILPDMREDQRFIRKVLLVNEVFAITPREHPLAAQKSVSCAQLLRERLIFRARGSSTQRVVDRYFKQRDAEPKPFLTLDTRDGVYEAVVNGMGIGFVWRTGTGRTNDVAQLRLLDGDTQSEEVAFAPKASQQETVSAFFRTIDAWRAKNKIDGLV